MDLPELCECLGHFARLPCTVTYLQNVVNGAIPSCAPLVLGLLHHVLQRPEREVRRCEGEVSHQGSTVGSRQDDSDQPPAAHHQPTAAPPPVIGGRCQHRPHRLRMSFRNAQAVKEVVHLVFASIQTDEEVNTLTS